MTDISFTNAGYEQINAILGSYYDGKECCLGTIEDGVITEADWGGYARAVIDVSPAVIQGGSSVQLAYVAFYGPSSGVDPGQYNVVYVVDDEGEPIAQAIFDDPANIPPGAVQRWQLTFRL